MDDAVSIDTDNEHIWVHNIDLFYGNTGGDADQAKGDGTIDLKGDSRYITISYNHLWDSGKASLCGMKSESGPNWITYHHNWFDHSDSRHPRIRTMSVHVWNNYFDGNAKYGVGAAYKSNAFVEANYFRACKYPMLISKQGSDIATNPKGTFSGEDGGMIKSYANRIVGAKGYVTWQQNATQFDAYEASSRDEQVPATVAALQGGRVFDNWDTDNAIMYDYTPDAADDVPAKVTGWLGAGRLGRPDRLF
jgi:pectate lyase